MTVSEALLNCISAALDGRACALTLAPDDWTALLRLAGEQKLLPLVYAAVRGTPGFAAAPEAVRAAARRQTMREAAAQTVHTEAFLRLYQALRAEGLAPVVVKGIVCRALYPQPELRPSSDEDLYLTAAEMPHFHAVLLRAGFVLTEPERDYRSAHEARYVHPDTGLVVEGHWALFPTEYAVYAALNVQLPDLMQRAQDWESGGVTLRVPDACDHLIFLLLHAFKHFISSGVGVRQLCDIALWMRRCARRTVRALPQRSSMRACIGSVLSARRRISRRTGRRSRARRCSPMRSPAACTAARTARAGTAARSPFTRQTGRIAVARGAHRSVRRSFPGAR